MAIIGRLRKKSGLLILVIGIAILGFILQDAFSNKGVFSQERNVGVIDGVNVSYIEFENKVTELTDLQKKNSGVENFSARDNFQIREQAWNFFLNKILMGKEYDRLGVVVTSAELSDMFYGENVHPQIMQMFTDPKTGQFNRQVIIQIINNLDQQTDEYKMEWINFETGIKENRLVEKYNNIINNSVYLPKKLAQKMYENQNGQVGLRMAVTDFSTIADDKVSLTDKDYQAYYDAHKSEFKATDISRDLVYVTFEARPTPEDVAAIAAQMHKLHDDFQTAENVKDFVNSTSDVRYDSTFFKRGQLSYMLDSLCFSAEIGTTTEPTIINNNFEMSRLVARESRADSIKVSHILVAFKGAYGAGEDITRTKEEAEHYADSLKNIIKTNPSVAMPMFAENVSDDPSAKENKGDMGWIIDNEHKFVSEFTQAAIDNKAGEVVVTETPFGYHIIYIAEKTAPITKVRVATVVRELMPSSSTFKSILTQASKFASDNRTLEQMEKTAAEKGINLRTADFITTSSYSLPGLNDSRDIVRWAFNKDTKVGTVSSEVYQYENIFVIAALKSARDKGIPTLETIKKNIEGLVRIEKKAEMLTEKVNKVTASTKDINAIAAQLNVQIDTVANVAFAGYGIGNRGWEPEVLGSAFAMSANQLSGAIKGKSGIFVLQIDQVVPAPKIEDYTMMKNQYVTMAAQKNYGLFKVIQDKSNIKDNRILFY